MCIKLGCGVINYINCDILVASGLDQSKVELGRIGLGPNFFFFFTLRRGEEGKIERGGKWVWDLGDGFSH